MQQQKDSSIRVRVRARLAEREVAPGAPLIEKLRVVLRLKAQDEARLARKGVKLV